MPARGFPPSSRSSACASTVLPAPVSPVSTLSPGPRRSSARSISNRFSTRSSSSTEPRWYQPPPTDRPVPAGGSHSGGEASELLAQAVVEACPGYLGQAAALRPEANVEALARRKLAHRPAVHRHVRGLLP